MMMIQYVLVVLGAVAIVHGGRSGDRGQPGPRGPTGSPYPRSVTKVLTVTNGGFVGEWEEAVFCPQNTFATGFGLEGSFYRSRSCRSRCDDTALNGIVLKCKSPGNNREAIAPPENRYGAEMKNCTKLGSSLFYLSAFQLYMDTRYGDNTGVRNFDYTGATGIDFKCRPESFPVDYTLAGEGAEWGKAGRWSASCPLGSSICGLQSKIDQGYTQDDSGLNDVKFFCCKHPTASTEPSHCNGRPGCYDYRYERELGQRGEA